MSTSFEKHARDQFEQHKVSVDVEALWDQVYPQVKEEKKDRKFLWFFLSGFLVSVALFSTFYFMQKEETDINKATATAFDKSISLEKGTKTSAVKEHNNDTDTANPNNTLTETTSSLATAKEVNKVDGSNNTKRSDSPSNNTASVISENRNQRTESQTYMAPVNESESTPNSASTKTTVIKIDNISNVVELSKAALPVSKEEKKKQEAELNSLVLQSLYPELFEDKSKEEINYPPIQDIAESKKDLHRDSPLNGMRFGIGAYAGIGKTTSSISSNEDDLSRAYLDLRKNSEEQLETMHFGLSAIVETKQNIYIRSGVEYTRIASLFSKETERVTVDSIPGIVEIRINEITNDTVEIEGFQEVTTTESYRKKTFNYYHLIDIPVILGYSFKYEKWQIGVEAGILANVYLQRKGSIFAADETFYDLDTDENKWHKSNIGITPFAGISAAYNISDSFQIHVSPSFRFKRTFTTGAYPGKVELASLGVRTGVRYFF
ncbi:MAG: hypothetical protein AB8F74_06330 [Saprospiraceae bacterium]